MRDYLKNLTEEQKGWVSFKTAANGEGKVYTVAEINADYYRQHNASALKILHDAGLQRDHRANFKENVLSGYFAEIAAFKALQKKFVNLKPASLAHSKYCDFEAGDNIFIEVKLCKNYEYVNLNISKLRQYLEFVKNNNAEGRFYFCCATPCYGAGKQGYALQTFCLTAENIARLKNLPVHDCTQPLNPVKHDKNKSGFVTVRLEDFGVENDVSYL